MKDTTETVQNLNYQTKKVKHGLSQKDLFEVFDYDKSTGKLFWKNRYHKRFNGKEAGNVETHGKTSHYNRIRVNIKGQRFMAHHIVWCIEYGEWLTDPNFVMDHINGDATDNRICNLRIVTYAGNSRNMVRLSTNKTGVAGVVYVRDRGKYRARIRDWDGNKVSLGSYDTLEEATEVRKRAEKEYGYHENFGREMR